MGNNVLTCITIFSTNSTRKRVTEPLIFISIVKSQGQVNDGLIGYSVSFGMYMLVQLQLREAVI